MYTSVGRSELASNWEPNLPAQSIKSELRYSIFAPENRHQAKFTTQ